jgi:RND family efflux transporter MFP subunit
MAQRHILRLGLPALASALLVFALISSTAHPQRPATEPAIAPPRAPFAAAVAGVGVVEPNSELIAIGTHLPGVIAAVHVQVGDKVQARDALFTIDDRDARARLESELARLESARVAQADAAQQYALYGAITDPRAVSQDELDRRRFAAEAADKAVREAQARVRVRRTELDRLTVRAPIDGSVLRVNTRVGEFAAAGALPEPLMVLGNLEPLHVRVEVDETDSGRLRFDASAVARVRGAADVKTALRYVRAEPLLRPKRTLTGDGNERIDTRVLQIIFTIEDAAFAARVGQQVDVYIEANPLPAPGGVS